jgi:hypothetical protein
MPYLQGTLRHGSKNAYHSVWTRTPIPPSGDVCFHRKTTALDTWDLEPLPLILTTTDHYTGTHGRCKAFACGQGRYNKDDHFSQTALIIASEENKRLIEILLSDVWVDVNRRDPDGNATLHVRMDVRLLFGVAQL